MPQLDSLFFFNAELSLLLFLYSIVFLFVLIILPLFYTYFWLSNLFDSRFLFGNFDINIKYDFFVNAFYNYSYNYDFIYTFYYPDYFGLLFFIPSVNVLKALRFYTGPWSRIFGGVYKLDTKLKSSIFLTNSHNHHIVLNCGFYNIILGIGLFIAATFFINYMHGGLFIYTSICLILVVILSILWSCTVVSESNLDSIYTTIVNTNVLSGVTLFILSEIMLFLAFFWAFFNSSISPSIFVGNVWPPINILTLDIFSLPLLNTLLLLTSGITCNWFFFTLNSYTYDIPNNRFRYNFDNNLLKSYNFFNITFKLSLQQLLKNLRILLRNFNIIRFCLVYILVARNDFYFWYEELLYHSARDTVELSRCLINIITSYGSYCLLTLWLFLSSTFFAILVLPVFNDMLRLLTTSRYLWSFYIQIKWRTLYQSLILTITLGLIFLIFQYYEYAYHMTYMHNNIFGTVFYLTTSLHGLHVLVGGLMFVFIFIRMYFLNNFNYSLSPHSGVTAAVWYWHFVDVVWLFLFIFVYVWSY